MFWVLLFMGGCSSLNEEEARRSLKVLDSNVNRLVYEMSELPEFRALWKMNEETALPFDFFMGRLIDPLNKKDFNLQHFAGTYTWEATSGTYRHSMEPRDQIHIAFPLDTSGIEIRLVILEYEDRKVDALKAFPVRFEERIFVDDVPRMHLSFSSRLVDKMPEHIDYQLRTDDIDFALEMNRTREGDSGSARWNSRVKYGTTTLFRLEALADLGYGRSGYYLKKVELNGKLMDHSVQGIIDYTRIDPNSKAYCASFNSNSDIRLYEGTTWVCNIILGEEKNQEEIELQVAFDGGQTASLDDYLLVVEDLYHYKL